MSIAYNLAAQLEELAKTLKTIDYERNTQQIDDTRLWIALEFDQLKREIQTYLSTIAKAPPPPPPIPAIITIHVVWDDGKVLIDYEVKTSMLIRDLAACLTRKYHVPSEELGLPPCSPDDTVWMVYNNLCTITLPAKYREVHYGLIITNGEADFHISYTQYNTIGQVKAATAPELDIDPCYQRYDQFPEVPDSASLYDAWLAAGKPIRINVSYNDDI